MHDRKNTFKIVDIFKKNKKKYIQNVGIVFISLLLGFGINMFIFGDSDISNKLKTNLGESITKDELNSNLYIERNNNAFLLKVGEEMKNVENISFSIVYNNKSIKIESLKATSKNIDIMNLSNYHGVNTIVLNLQKKSNINKNDILFSFKVLKENNIPESINIISANFTDSDGETYLLSTSGIEL